MIRSSLPGSSLVEHKPSFLEDIPTDVDPCGENGELHSFAFDGPMFQYTIDQSLGKIAYRDVFVFADLLLCGASGPEKITTCEGLINSVIHIPNLSGTSGSQVYYIVLDTGFHRHD